LEDWIKQKFTHEITTKNTKSYTPDYRKTKNCTPENKKSHTKLQKKYRIAHAKAQNYKPDYSKKQQKNHIPDCNKNNNLNHTKIARKNTHTTT
jgi:hypothetical protein